MNFENPIFNFKKKITQAGLGLFWKNLMSKRFSEFYNYSTFIDFIITGASGLSSAPG